MIKCASQAIFLLLRSLLNTVLPVTASKHKSTGILVEAASLLDLCTVYTVQDLSQNQLGCIVQYTCCNLLLPPAQYVTFMTAAIIQTHEKLGTYFDA